MKVLYKLRGHKDNCLLENVDTVKSYCGDYLEVYQSNELEPVIIYFNECLNVIVFE